MKISKYTNSPSRAFDGDAVKGVEARVVIGRNDGASNFCMRVFEIETGGFTPRHSHPWEHEIFVHSGSGQVFNEGSWVDIKTGSVLFIPGNEEHQIKNTGNEKLTFVCLIPSGPDEL